MIGKLAAASFNRCAMLAPPMAALDDKL